MTDFTERIEKLSPKQRELLMRRMTKKVRDVVGAQTPPPQPRSPGDRVPLSFSQQRVWFLEKLTPGSVAYVLAGALRFRGVLDVGALERSLTEIVRRHEVLRTIFPDHEGEPWQEVLPPAPHPLPQVDLCVHPPAERGHAFRSRAAREAGRPFDITKGPLLRTLLMKVNDTPGQEEHMLVYCFHHLIFDGWSFRVLLDELPRLYDVYRQGGEDTVSLLPELPLQYGDFAIWERDLLQGEVLEKRLRWWIDHLHGAPPRLDLPVDRPYPSEQSFNGDRRRFKLTEEPGKTIRETARQEEATPFMVLLAAFKAFLHRITHQDDVVVGYPVARRTHSELEKLIGFFANTLALRTRLRPEGSFRNLVRDVRETTLGASANQEIPFEKLVDELEVERELSHSPVFQVMFNLQTITEKVIPVGDLLVDFVPVEVRRSQFELSLTMADDGVSYFGWLEFNVDLFDKTTAERFLRTYKRLLRAAITHPETPIRELPLMGRTECHQLLGEWNDTVTAGGGAVLLPDLFAAQVARTPDSIALRFGAVEQTYRQLDEKSDRLASHLRHLGAGPEVRVGVFLERSADLVVALLAVLKAGAAYVPLDPIYPRERLAYMLEDSGAEFLLTEGNLPSRLELAPTLRVVRIGDERHAEPDRAPPLDGANLAYTIYTSGSTGKPKGVQIHHAALANFLVSMAQRPGFECGDTLLALTTVCFDIAGLELFLPLIRGGRVVVASREATSDGLLLARTVKQSHATVVQATPATWRMLVEAGWKTSWRVKVLCGGEALPATLASALLEAGVELWNVYGPTETTVWSTVRRIDESFADGNARIGRPIAKTSIHLVDRGLQPVPVGVTGELLIGGDGLARGYLGRPGLTAERFVPAVGGRPGERLYRTGDLARWVGDGDLEILGRVDHQVKLRGFRIELGEIEAALAAHPDVIEGAVVLREDGALKRLVAYLVSRSGETLAPEELRHFLSLTLPDYMVPTAYVFLENLPLTANGKVDRRSLPAPEDSAMAAEEYVAPSTPAEETLAAVWSEVLGIERVGVRDNFFSLGGDSILAIQVVTRARQAGWQIVPRDLFHHQVLEQLAAAVAELVPEDTLTEDKPEYVNDTDLIGQEDLEEIFQDLGL